MKIIVKVTKEVLEKTKMCGAKHESVAENCPIAYALSQLFGRMSVGPYIGFKDFNVWMDTPSHVYKWILIFDKASPKMRPLLPNFSFEIDVPSKVIEKIGIGEVYRVLSESKTLEHVN